MRHHTSQTDQVGNVHATRAMMVATHRMTVSRVRRVDTAQRAPVGSAMPWDDAGLRLGRRPYTVQKPSASSASINAPKNGRSGSNVLARPRPTPNVTKSSGPAQHRDPSTAAATPPAPVRIVLRTEPGAPARGTLLSVVREDGEDRARLGATVLLAAADEFLQCELEALQLR